jgi:lysophospholipase L1-like esterase
MEAKAEHSVLETHSSPNTFENTPMNILVKFRPTNWQRIAILVAFLSFVTGYAIRAAEPDKPKDSFARWEKDISAMEAGDAKQAPPTEGIVFVGSSSVRMWKLPQWFPNMPVINRGFGGSQLADSVHFAPRIVTPYKPRVVVLYAGDNDMAAGKTPERVAEDYRQFVAAVRKELPETRIVYIGIKPSIKRWNLIDKVRATNKLIADMAATDDKQVFVDIDQPMQGDDGKPKPELFQKDGLHMTDAGYEIWTNLVMPHLK